MAEVTIKINGKPFGIACDDGQEERVRQLGEYINERYMSIVAGGGGTNDTQNMVLTAIILADEIADLREYSRQLEEQVTNPEGNVQIKEVEVVKEVPVPQEGALTEEDIDQVAEVVMEVTNRINSLSNKLAKAA